jgi:hypothetical protein
LKRTKLFSCQFILHRGLAVALALLGRPRWDTKTLLCHSLVLFQHYAAFIMEMMLVKTPTSAKIEKVINKAVEPNFKFIFW